MSRPPFPTVEYEVIQAKHELAQALERDHDVKSPCWCCCLICARRFAEKLPAQESRT